MVEKDVLGAAQLAGGLFVFPKRGMKRRANLYRRQAKAQPHLCNADVSGGFNEVVFDSGHGVRTVSLG